MTTTNPRVHVTLSPSLFQLVGSMARSQRVSRSQVLRELLEAAEPALQRVVALMDAAERAKGAVNTQFGESLLRSQELIEAEMNRNIEKLDGMTGDLVSMAQRVEGRRPSGRATTKEAHGAKGAELPSTPVPVTRGSGPLGKPVEAKKEGGGNPGLPARKGVTRGRV